MKKAVYLLAAAAMMASCNQEGILVDPAEVTADVPRAIGFETFVDKATRATDANNSTALNDYYPTFNVYGWKTVGQEEPVCVFNNIPVEFFAQDAQGEVVYNEEGEKPSNEWTFEANNWYYENLRYWDKMASEYLFSAYAPAAASTVVGCDATGLITIGSVDAPITVEGTNLMEDAPAEALAYTGFEYDYMTAQATDKVGQVSLTFNHLQAKLNIRIKLSDAITTAQDVSIQKIQIHNLSDKAYYTNAAGVGVSGWTIAETSANYVPGIATAYTLNNATANYHNHYVLEQLIIPQTIDKYVGNDLSSIAEYTEACVYVEYTIGAEKFKSYSPLANIFIEDGTTTTYDFKGGNQYTLNITVGPAPIEFKAEVAEWAEAVQGGLDMD